MSNPNTISDRQLPTVLAALRFLQDNLDNALPLFEEYGYFHEHPPLDKLEIDQLTESLNHPHSTC